MNMVTIAGNYFILLSAAKYTTLNCAQNQGQLLQPARHAKEIILKITKVYQDLSRFKNRSNPNSSLHKIIHRLHIM